MLSSRTRLVYLFGQPVAHSRSPALHNAAFRALGLDLAYAAVPVASGDLAAAVRGLKALCAVGGNVTVPYKEAVVPLVDTLSGAARAIGAVNTLVVHEDASGRRLVEGDNTDAAGFLDGFGPQRRLVHGAETVVFGAGGAARAAVYALLTGLEPSRLTIVARTPERAEALANALAPLDPNGALEVVAAADARERVREARLLVNASSAGMQPNAQTTPWEDDADFGPHQLAYDLVYAPHETRFLRDARGHGASTVGGLAMLGSQADRAFQRWTGQPIPREVLKAWLETA